MGKDWENVEVHDFKSLQFFKEKVGGNMQVQTLGLEYSLEEEMATPSNILAERIPWTEEPGGLQSMGFQRVGHRMK